MLHIDYDVWALMQDPGSFSVPEMLSVCGSCPKTGMGPFTMIQIVPLYISPMLGTGFQSLQLVSGPC